MLLLLLKELSLTVQRSGATPLIRALQCGVDFGNNLGRGIATCDETRKGCHLATQDIRWLLQSQRSASHVHRWRSLFGGVAGCCVLAGLSCRPSAKEDYQQS